MSDLNHKGVEEILEMLNSLRDDAPVFPMWTIGDIKAVIKEQKERAYREAVRDILNMADYGGRITRSISRKRIETYYLQLKSKQKDANKALREQQRQVAHFNPAEIERNKLREAHPANKPNSKGDDD